MTTRRGSQSFSQMVEAFVKKVEARGAAFLRAYSHAVVRELVLRSPVGDPSTWQNPPPPGYVPGHFRANWRASLSGPETGVLPGVDSDGSATVAAADLAVLGARLGSRISISNNVPYARRLEYGWSKQAPLGIVRVTMAQSRTMVLEALAEARRVVP